MLSIYEVYTGSPASNGPLYYIIIIFWLTCVTGWHHSSFLSTAGLGKVSTSHLCFATGGRHLRRSRLGCMFAPQQPKSTTIHTLFVQGCQWFMMRHMNINSFCMFSNPPQSCTQNGECKRHYILPHPIFLHQVKHSMMSQLCCSHLQFATFMQAYDGPRNYNRNGPNSALSMPGNSFWPTLKILTSG